MIDGKSVLAVIPARGGSKRFPRKNLAMFRGRPLFEWSVIAALKSQYIDQLTLSSEDPEILSAACFLKGLNVLPRPLNLATDDATCEDVLRHALSVNEHAKFEWVVLLQPSSPLRTTEDIDNCIVLALNQDGCVSYNEDTGKKNGAVYVIRSEALLSGRNFSRPFPHFYLMPASRSLDIDYAKDMEPYDFVSSDRPA